MHAFYSVHAFSPHSDWDSTLKTYTLYCVIWCRMKTTCLREDVLWFTGHYYRMAHSSYESYETAYHAGQIQFKYWYGL